MHGYSGRKTASPFDCSDTTVPRCVHAGIDGRRRLLKLERRRPTPSLSHREGDDDVYLCVAVGFVEAPAASGASADLRLDRGDAQPERGCDLGGHDAA